MIIEQHPAFPFVSRLRVSSAFWWQTWQNIYFPTNYHLKGGFQANAISNAPRSQWYNIRNRNRTLAALKGRLRGKTPWRLLLHQQTFLLPRLSWYPLESPYLYKLTSSLRSKRSKCEKQYHSKTRAPPIRWRGKTPYDQLPLLVDAKGEGVGVTKSPTPRRSVPIIRPGTLASVEATTDLIQNEDYART